MKEVAFVDSLVNVTMAFGAISNVNAEVGAAGTASFFVHDVTNIEFRIAKTRTKFLLMFARGWVSKGARNENAWWRIRTLMSFIDSSWEMTLLRFKDFLTHQVITNSMAKIFPEMILPHVQDLEKRHEFCWIYFPKCLFDPDLPKIQKAECQASKKNFPGWSVRESLMDKFRRLYATVQILVNVITCVQFASDPVAGDWLVIVRVVPDTTKVVVPFEAGVLVIVLPLVV
jgi:hypothetical protein